MKTFFRRGAGSLLLGIALLTFTYLGSNGIIELGEEIREPGKVIPRAYFIAFPIITIIYLLVALAVVNAVPWQTLADVREPLIDIGRATMGRCGLYFSSWAARCSRLPRRSTDYSSCRRNP